MNMQAVLKEIDAWPVDDQLELLEKVWDKLADSGWTPTLSAEQKAELDRRAAELDANPEIGLTWEEIVEHVRRSR